MQSGSQILSYEGNKNLGLGSNASIPAINPNANLDVINNAARDIMMKNHETNLMLYQQKINDRNTALGMLAKGEIASGKISAEDRKIYEKGRAEVESKFYDMVAKGGINNAEAYKDVLDKSTDLQNITTWAQNRELGLTALEQEKSQKTLDVDIKAYDNHIKAQKEKPFWEAIDPFQKAFDFDIDSMRKSIAGTGTVQGKGGIGKVQEPAQTTTTTTTTDGKPTTTKQVTKAGAQTPTRSGKITNGANGKPPITISGSEMNADGTLNPISYTPESYWDLGSMLKNAREDMSEPVQAQNQREWLKSVSEYDEPQKAALVKAYNERLAKYSEERGIEPIGTNPDGSLLYEAQIRVATDPTGKILINESPAEFAAKSTLASIDGSYVQKPQAQFDDKIGAYNIGKQKANSDEFYKKALASAAIMKAKTDQAKGAAYVRSVNQKINAINDEKEKDAFLNDLYTKNYMAQEIIEGVGNGEYKLATIPAEKSTPMFTFDGTKSVLLIPKGGTPSTEMVNGKAVSVRKGGYYEQEYTLNGKPIKISDIGDLYKTFKKNMGSEWKGGVSDFLKGYVENGLMEVNFVGENGTTNKEFSNAALKYKTTKKGQKSVFSEEEPLPTITADDAAQDD